MKLCVSIQPRSLKEAKKLLKQFAKSQVLVEIRTDHLKNLNISRLLSFPRPKVIITFPDKLNKKISSQDYKKYYNLLQIATKNEAEYIDIGISFGKKFIKKFKSEKTKIPELICSYHNYKKTPKNLLQIYKKIKSFNPDIIKIATMGNNISDNKIIFNILAQAKIDGKNLIGICMGEHGEISRILGGKFGSYIGYTHPEERAMTAPGQYSYNQMKYLFRADCITKKTKIFGLIGNPVKYSKGIYFHNKIFSKNKVDAVYVNFLVDNLTTFFSSFMEYITGLSVTMPFKNEVVKYVDFIENEAKDLNILNTILKKNNRIIGYNSDLYAIKTILKRVGVNKKTRIIILGAGNMGKTILFVCNKFGARPIVVTRNIQKSLELTKHFDCYISDYKNIKDPDCDLLINATSVGMGVTNIMPPIPNSIFNQKPTVIDVIANPSRTKLIETAMEYDCKTITGDEIFSIQARYQSSLFLELCK